MWTEYINATSVEQVIHILAKHGERARVVAGGTDLILELERGVRKGINVLIDVTRISGLDNVTMDGNDVIHLGPLVTHNHCVASKLIVERAFPLARAALEVGAPQIRNRGTIAGNLITASPANDTITPLIALNCQLTFRSLEGERVIPLDEFYKGVRHTEMRPDEMLVDIAFPALSTDQCGTFVKLGLRLAQAISLINVAVILTLQAGRISKAVITLGSVAPTIVHALKAEEFLSGKSLDEVTIARAAELAREEARSIDDVRSSAEYRNEMVRVGTLRCLRSLAKRTEKADYPTKPILLWGEEYKGSAPILAEATYHALQPIVTNINGVDYTFKTGYDKTLLRLLREEAGLIGTKEGCAEGECGACTVYLDGVAVMSCLVPAPRAQGARIVTVEGLAANGKLHPVQQAFIDTGAVQCGYCTPGFIMSAAKLLEEKSHPTLNDIQQSISGNLCRCTGYYSIVKAIELAAQRSGSHIKEEGNYGQV
jgi:xanthine dehydrogenase iron-sulfur cluster and FAD-binding subunit A